MRGDDEAGLVAARILRDGTPERLTVLEHDGDPATLIDAWAGADAVFVIDAVSSGAPPGSLRVIDARSSALSGELFRHSTHSFGLAEAVELSKALGNLPAAFWIFGVEGNDFRLGSAPSAEVIRGVNAAVEALLQKLVELGIAGSND
jgi:hydrogenase maturation protease